MNNPRRTALTGIPAPRNGLTLQERAAMLAQVERLYRARCANVGRTDALSPDRVAAWVERQTVCVGDDLDPCTWVDALEYEAHTSEYFDLEGTE